MSLCFCTTKTTPRPLARGKLAMRPVVAMDFVKRIINHQQFITILSDLFWTFQSQKSYTVNLGRTVIRILGY
jgi:hypothetical protein